LPLSQTRSITGVFFLAAVFAERAISKIGGTVMQFVLWFRWQPEKTRELLELWKEFKYPKEVKLIQRYIIIGRHTSFAVFDAPDVESIMKITAPFSPFGVAKIAPIMPLEKAIAMEL